MRVSSCGCVFLRGAAGALGLALRPPVLLQSHVAEVVPSRPRLQQCIPATRALLHVGSGRVGCVPHPAASDSQRTLRRPSRLLGEAAQPSPPLLSPRVPPHAAAARDDVPHVAPSGDSALARARREARFDEEGEYRVFRELLEGKKTRFVSRVMYDGTNYKGFQVQNSGLPTVQVRTAAVICIQRTCAVQRVLAGACTQLMFVALNRGVRHSHLASRRRQQPAQPVMFQ